MSGYRLAGRATPEATGAHAAGFAGLGPRAFGPLGRTGLTVSRLGFGGYRVDDETPAHRAALERALLAGVNLIDTSTNYTDGGSERLVGQVLGDLVERGTRRRDEIVVVSKIGYVQGQNLALARERRAESRPFPEMVEYMDGCWHCLHPEFLADQLPRSLDRLGLDTLDVCLLHNPEYFLADARQRGLGPPPALREEFYHRLAEAFRFFEAEVAAGRLASYGVSSNTCTSPAHDPEATSLARMLEAARAAGGPDHHFRVLQLPMNLLEAGAIRERNTERQDDRASGSTARSGPGPAGTDGMYPDTPLETAIRQQIAVLVNRPLNAFSGGGMRRLADFPLDPAPAPEAQLAALGELEAGFRQDIASRLQVTRGSGAPGDLFRWAQHLEGLAGSLQSLDHWQKIEGDMVRPRVTHAVRALDAGLRGELGERWQQWRGRYLAELDRTFAAFRRAGAARSQAESRRVADAVDPLLPAPRRRHTLSRKALWVLASTPGVSALLVGMRRATYVDDAIEILRWPALEAAAAVYDAVARQESPAATPSGEEHGDG